jgi:hypothetical protein
VGVWPGVAGSFPGRSEILPPAPNIMSARSEYQERALNISRAGGKNLFFLFSFLELPYFRQVTLLLFDDAKVVQIERNAK